ncbi:MAG: DNA topoisomerase IV subunit A [Deltaproteobacteria bacterium]|nr:DNA topoisomerase IV subunit A [Deltaproteobacteria bacterium]MBW2373113.1 DNA topoisomerase IV subunit A [Deltaproteobacteria bacterium]
MAARKKKTARKTTKKAATRKTATRKRRATGSAQHVGATDEQTVKAIVDTAGDVHKTIGRLQKPDLAFPMRALSNVSYSQKKGYFEIGKQKKIRTLTVNTVRTFAQTLRMMGLSKELVESNDFATKRDAYYQSKNWEEARFDEQTESDAVMDDIEALFSTRSISREQLRFVPDEHGGAVSGQLVVLDPDRETGEVVRIDCTRFGSGAYSIPSSVEQLSFETDAKFILAIETGGMFQRLQSHKFWETANCILVSMAGVPTRATRRFIRKLSDECKLPVFAFVDCDPYGISNIYRTLKVGSGNAAHLSQFFCVPQASFLGVTPQDIIDYDLPTHPLQEVDVKRAKDALKNDPFFQSHKEWRKAIEKLLKMNVRAEQQALAKWGLNYVIEEYLPRKLANPARFLP